MNKEELSGRLSRATRAAYDTNLNHALKQRAYEREAGDQSNDPTRVHTSIESVIKREMGPTWAGLIVVELSDMGDATCKVYQGEAEDEAALRALFTHNRTSTV